MLNLTTPAPFLNLPLADNATGIRETLKHMRTLVDMGKNDPGLRHFANGLVARVPAKDWLGQMRVVFNWVRKNIRYTLDTNDTEVIQRADVTLRVRYGDCDDFCILIATLLEHLGYSTAFCALGFEQVGLYSHVIVLAEIPGETPLVSLDATEASPMGWFPPGATCAMLCPISWGSRFAWAAGGNAD